MSVGSIQGDGLQQFLLRRLPERFSGETFRFRFASRFGEMDRIFSKITLQTFLILTSITIGGNNHFTYQRCLCSTTEDPNLVCLVVVVVAEYATPMAMVRRDIPEHIP